MISYLGSGGDIALYQEGGAEICPDSEKLNHDIGFRISQVSDCVIVSAEVSPFGLINIVNYCRKIAERSLIREEVLCQGYLTKAQIYHEGMMFFGSGYQEALEGEKSAVGVEWEDGILGTLFIEVCSSSVMPYLKANQDECLREQFERMTISRYD